MLIAEFVIDHPVFGESLHRVPDIEIEWEDTYNRPDGPSQVIVWIAADDFTAVESAIADDEAVKNPTNLVDFGDRRLYRVDLTDYGHQSLIMPKLFEVGGVLKEGIGTNDGWWFQARFPNRAAFEHVYEFCQEQDMAFEFKRLFEQGAENRGQSSTVSMLTEEQREALVTAWDHGFFEVPRKTTLVELADELGISDSAVSQRLRRAHQKICDYEFGEGGSPIERGGESPTIAVTR